MAFEFYSDQGHALGDQPPPDWDIAWFSFDCTSYTGIACSFSSPGAVAELGELRTSTWQSPTITLTENSTNSSLDNKVHFDIAYTVSSNGPKRRSPVQVTRCDRADYASGGGCVFMDVDPYIRFHLGDTSMTDAVKHIWDAQYDILSTKPGIIDTITMGSRQSGYSLHRLYPGYNNARYNRNNYIAVQTCKKEWGDDYATSDPNGPRECDEYPFRSTFEGAAYVEYEGDPNGVFSYSARVMRWDHNNAAGRALGRYYSADHIIHTDRFWVEVVP